MKTKILIGILAVMLSFPASSHALGLLRYVFDAVANQFGLDRGPIPKALPQMPPPGGAVPRLPLRANILMLTGFTSKQKVFEGLWIQSGGLSCDKGLPDCRSSGSRLVSP